MKIKNISILANVDWENRDHEKYYASAINGKISEDGWVNLTRLLDLLNWNIEDLEIVKGEE